MRKVLIFQYMGDVFEYKVDNEEKNDKYSKIKIL